MNMKYDTDTPELLDSIICFIDILGYSKMIRDSHKNGLGNEVLKKILSVLDNKEYFLNLPSLNIYTKAFTDCILVAIPIEKEDVALSKYQGAWEMVSLLYQISSYQFELAMNGIFIRGGDLSGDELYE